MFGYWVHNGLVEAYQNDHHHRHLSAGTREEQAAASDRHDWIIILDGLHGIEIELSQVLDASYNRLDSHDRIYPQDHTSVPGAFPQLISDQFYFEDGQPAVLIFFWRQHRVFTEVSFACEILP